MYDTNRMDFKINIHRHYDLDPFKGALSWVWQYGQIPELLRAWATALHQTAVNVVDILQFTWVVAVHSSSLPLPC